MSEPNRLRDDGPDDLRELLQAGAPTRSITSQQRLRTAKRVARHAGAAAVAASLSWAPGAALGAWLGVAALLIVWVVPGWIAPQPRSPVASAVPPSSAAPAVGVLASSVPSAVPVVPSVVSSSATPASAPSAPAGARPGVSPSAAASSEASAAPAPSGDPLAEEVALLDRARGALAAGPAEALALTEAHAARFPAGKLGMEREMVAIDALRRLGRTGDARARAEAMLARTQGSLYEPRVRKLLEGMR